MNPLYISFYTIGTGYEEEARCLVDSLNAFGLPHDVRGEPNLGEWRLNTQHKAVFIRRMMYEHKGRPLVWLDADARVRKYPDELAQLSGDFAAHWKDGRELLASTLWFGPTENAQLIVDEWILRNTRNPFGKYGDQANLQEVIERLTGLQLIRLSSSYAKIFDLMDGDPVIEQLQASRKFKDTVGT